MKYTKGTVLFVYCTFVYASSKNIQTLQELNELESHDDYTDFALDIRPSIDFISELLSKTDGLDVLEPASLKNSLRTILETALSRNP